MVGMILGSPAQVAGVEQGDQLLQIDSMQVDGQSPFQAASAISGGDADEDAVPEPVVNLQVLDLPDGCMTPWRTCLLTVCTKNLSRPLQSHPE